MQLFHSDTLNITITSQTGTSLSCDHNFHADFQSTASGFSCYITGAYPQGLSGQNSILLRFEETVREIDYVAIVNHSPFWCRPFFGNDLSKLPDKTQELLAFDGETWHCILPVCADTFKTVLRGAETGFELVVYSACDGITDCSNQLAFLYETGTDPHALLRSCASQAAKRLGNGLKMREERKLSPVFEYLGWCSWDALQIRINHQSLLEKAAEFHEKQIPIGFAILDDMWAHVPNLQGMPEDIDFNEMAQIMHVSPLECFEGDPLRFPQGMQAAVTDLKKAGIPKVGIWFPTTGYWGGFVPNGKDALALGNCLEQTSNLLWRSAPEGGTLIVKPTAEAAQAYFSELCSRIWDWGADFVKIDNQGCHSYYQNVAPIGQTSQNLQQAIDQATGKYFDGALINCMGMPSECMFHRPDSAVCRCSDDFIPESRDWFAKNILQCSYNGILQGQYYVNDWDMWWTNDEQAVKNSLCRAISGGPIYISDKIGCTRPEILKPLCLRDGRILRCDNSAVPTADCLLHDPTVSGVPFKIYNRVGRNGLIAAFNIDKNNRPAFGTVRPEDAGLPTGAYAYYEFFSQKSGLLQPGDAIALNLDDQDTVRLYTFLPAEEITVLGRSDLFIGVKTICEATNNRVTLLEGGEIGFISRNPIRVFANSQELQTIRKGLLTTVTCPPDVTELTFVAI